MTKALADYPGKEAVLITVDYAPGGESSVHRHNAHAFVYVLEGSIVMGLRGGTARTNSDRERNIRLDEVYSRSLKAYIPAAN